MAFIEFLLFAYNIGAVALYKGMKTGSPYTLQSFTKRFEICISCVTGPLFQLHTLSKAVFATPGLTRWLY